MALYIANIEEKFFYDGKSEMCHCTYCENKGFVAKKGYFLTKSKTMRRYTAYIYVCLQCRNEGKQGIPV